jgi:acetylornithine deacetylase/succinyl-diaminopimelate desuccinylase-like protein
MAGLRDRFVAELREFCAIPSVASDAEPCQHAVEFLTRAMERRGVEVKIVETALNPVVYGVKRGASQRSILFYSHYDVVPAGSETEWDSPAFDPAIRDDRIWARGVADHKGSCLARIQALDLLATWGVPLPVSVTFLIEGNEEIGSQGLFDALMVLRDELVGAEGGFYSGWSRDLEGRPRINAGMRGACTLHVELRNTRRDLHVAYGSVVRNPLMSLIRLLSSLVGEDGQVAVPGFRESADPPSAADLAALNAIPFDAGLFRSTFDVQQFVGETTDPASLLAQQFFSPMITVYDIQTSGVPGISVPATASAKVRASLVPDQDPEQIAGLLENYLHAQAELPITITRGTSMRPARASLESTAVDVAVRSVRAAFGQDPVVFPMSSGTGPRGLFVDAIGLPLIADAGVSHAESNDHSANENIYVDHYLAGVEHYAQIMQLWPSDR